MRIFYALILSLSLHCYLKREKFDRKKGSEEESKRIAELGEHERVVERSQADRHLLWHRPGRTHLK